jgi:hypothetical protein
VETRENDVEAGTGSCRECVEGLEDENGL